MVAPGLLNFCVQPYRLALRRFRMQPPTIQQILQGLSDDERKLLYWLVKEGKTVPEASSAMGYTKSWGYGPLNRIVQAFQIGNLPRADQIPWLVTNLKNDITWDKDLVEQPSGVVQRFSHDDAVAIPRRFVWLTLAGMVVLIVVVGTLAFGYGRTVVTAPVAAAAPTLAPTPVPTAAPAQVDTVVPTQAPTPNTGATVQAAVNATLKAQVTPTPLGPTNTPIPPTPTRVPPTPTEVPKPGLAKEWNADTGWSDWPAAGAWSISRGRLVNNGQSGDPIFAPYRPPLPNYAIEAVVEILPQYDPYLGLFVRRTTRQENGYMAWVGGNNTTGIDEWVPCRSGCFKRARTLSQGPSGTHTYRFEADGENLTLSVDGAVKSSRKDFSFMTGDNIGLTADGSQIIVSSFKVVLL